MASRIENQTDERILRLRNDLRQMEKLHQLMPANVRFITEGKDPSAPNYYYVELNIKSITGITNFGVPVLNDKFKMEIFLPNGYPTRRHAEVAVFPAPFHPHFSIRKRFLGIEYGKWVHPDPSPKLNGLGNVILHLLRSLRFETSFIETSGMKIGNKKALDWYIYWASSFERGIKPWFPSDQINLALSLSDEKNKKFEVQSKQFSLSGTGSLSGNKNLIVAERKSFEIIASTPPYRPTVASIPGFQRKLASDFRNGSKAHHLYIKSEAVKKIVRHISWGSSAEINKVEQGGILLGRAYRDQDQNTTFGVIEDAIPGETAVGTSAYLEMDHATWKKMIDQADALVDSNLERELHILGWYHTHPNQLDVFMSRTDQGTQARFFSNDWQFAIVLNPHRKIWRAFHGENAEECLGFFVQE